VAIGDGRLSVERLAVARDVGRLKGRSFEVDFAQRRAQEVGHALSLGRAADPHDGHSLTRSRALVAAPALKINVVPPSLIHPIAAITC